SSLVAVEPAGGCRPDVSCRMNGTSRDQKLFSDRRVTDLPCDLELHLAFQDDDQFIGCMREILPSPPWRVDPEVATEPPLRPIGGNLLPLYDCHRQMSLQGSRLCRQARVTRMPDRGRDRTRSSRPLRRRTAG